MQWWKYYVIHICLLFLTSNKFLECLHAWKSAFLPKNKRLLLHKDVLINLAQQILIETRITKTSWEKHLFAKTIYLYKLK